MRKFGSLQRHLDLRHHLNNLKKCLLKYADDIKVANYRLNCIFLFLSLVVPKYTDRTGKVVQFLTAVEY